MIDCDDEDDDDDEDQRYASCSSPGSMSASTGVPNELADGEAFAMDRLGLFRSEHQQRLVAVALVDLVHVRRAQGVGLEGRSVPRHVS